MRLASWDRTSSAGGVAGSRAPRSSCRATWMLAFAAILAASSPAAAASSASLLTPRLVVNGFSDGSSFSQPRGIAFDPVDGALYVANTGANRIEVFSRTGRPLSRFVHRATRPDGSVVDGEPCALAFDRSGRLLVADHAAAYVDVLDRRGRSVSRLEIPTGYPSAIAVGSDGTIFVGTTGKDSRIHRFRPDYTPDGAWGVAGTEAGQLFWVTGLGVLADGNLAVACARAKFGIQIFTPEGEYLKGFAARELGKGNVSLPSGVIGTADGRIWVADEIRQTIQVYDREGVFLAQTGGRGAAPGQFAQPSSLGSDGRGLIAVTDKEIGRIQVLGISEE